MNARLIAATVTGFLAVAFGAFGAHALDGRLSADAEGWWQTATQYALPHAVAALAVSLSNLRGLAASSAWLFVLGALVFAGSLYAMALTGVSGLGAITPIGGVAMLAGWVMLGVSGLRKTAA